MKKYCIFIISGLLIATFAKASITLPDGLNHNEWQAIQNQIKANHYKPQQSRDGSYQAINHQHGFNIHYGQDGKTTLKSYRSGDYHIGMRLHKVAEASMPEKPKSVTTAENKLSYHWNDNLEEFWINSEQQLEQWFTLKSKPVRKNETDDLVLMLALDSNLQIQQANNQLSFSGQGKNITYDKLKVWDATGQIIMAQMQLKDNLLQLIVQD